MSETVRIKGKLTQISSPIERLEPLAEKLLNERGKSIHGEPYYKSSLEYLLDEFSKEFVEVKGVLYKLSDVEEVDASDHFVAKQNKKTIDFDVCFYNGGCCLSEALEEALKNKK